MEHTFWYKEQASCSWKA